MTIDMLSGITCKVCSIY